MNLRMPYFIIITPVCRTIYRAVNMLEYFYVLRVKFQDYPV